ncbi:MAG: helix-turn-helix domain-containing protein [Lachnospiraceae bacterium]|nr:helix-turn-helix domain-containing protein [Lachnospiraceae bacterium]
MIIEKRTAKEIVLRLSDTIGQNINIMDTDGVIIASSDPAREGKVHGGALKLLRERLDRLIVESNDQFPGARKGVNLPVVFNSEVVGVIGITGDVGEVYKYGEIIKKMTEVLLLEERAKDLDVIEQKARDRFFNEWVIDGLEDRSPARFGALITALSVDTGIPYRIVAIAPFTNPGLSDDTHTEISRIVRRTVAKELKGNVFRTASRMILIIPERSVPRLDDVMSAIRSRILTSYSVKIKTGASDSGAVLHLTGAYNRAVAALERAIEADLPAPVTYYDPFDINYLLRDLAPAARKSYLDALFGDASPEVRSSALDFASVYLEENGSLEAIAERLFVHKNTVKYRIQKLTQLTGTDIRTCRGAYDFPLAAQIRA